MAGDFLEIEESELREIRLRHLTWIMRLHDRLWPFKQRFFGWIPCNCRGRARKLASWEAAIRRLFRKP